MLQCKTPNTWIFCFINKLLLFYCTFTTRAPFFLRACIISTLNNGVSNYLANQLMRGLLKNDFNFFHKKLGGYA